MLNKNMTPKERKKKCIKWFILWKGQRAVHISIKAGRCSVFTLLIRGLIIGPIESGEDSVARVFHLQQISHLTDGTQSLQRHTHTHEVTHKITVSYTGSFFRCSPPHKKKTQPTHLDDSQDCVTKKKKEQNYWGGNR